MKVGQTFQRKPVFPKWAGKIRITSDKGKLVNQVEMKQAMKESDFEQEETTTKGSEEAQRSRVINIFFPKKKLVRIIENNEKPKFNSPDPKNRNSYAESPFHKFVEQNCSPIPNILTTPSKKRTFKYAARSLFTNWYV
jgi:hypothetical protein